MHINELYDVDIFIDDLNIFNAKYTTLNKASIYESVMKGIPTCELDLSLPIQWFDYRSIVDGTKIKFIIKCETYKLNETYNFRIYNVKRIEVNQQFVQLFIEGIIDFFDGYKDANQFNLCAPSSEIFKRIAGVHNLSYEIDDTSDKQLWTAGNHNIFQFCNSICSHGYVNETSGMFWCIDRQKRLLYKNITSLFRNRQANVYTFVQSINRNTASKKFGYSTVKGSVQAGTNNIKNDGYGGGDVYFDLLSYNWKEARSKKVVAESNLINVSKELSAGLSQDWFAFNVGNFHPKYYEALKQNRRVLSTYSSYVTLTSQFFEPYRLAQVVQFEYLDSQDPALKLVALSGIYMIDAIRIDITTAGVNSILELVMQGLNGTATTREVY